MPVYRHVYTKVFITMITIALIGFTFIFIVDVFIKYKTNYWFL